MRCRPPGQPGLEACKKEFCRFYRVRPVNRDAVPGLAALQKKPSRQGCRRTVQLLIQDALVLKDAGCLSGISRSRSAKQVSKIHRGLAAYGCRTLDLSKYSNCLLAHISHHEEFRRIRSRSARSDTGEFPRCGLLPLKRTDA